MEGTWSFSHDRPVPGDLLKKATEMKVLSKEVRVCADTIFFLKKKHHVNFGICPCVKSTNLNSDGHMAINADFDILRHRNSPVRSQRKVVRKDHLHY